ncbi:hypothetical protein F5X99DRAFT_389406 [Biscogniauxia marginata]|nr:hypothetical protein F5X99DRAFT_389406 [Biscogniauxia marginata]
MHEFLVNLHILAYILPSTLLNLLKFLREAVRLVYRMLPVKISLVVWPHGDGDTGGLICNRVYRLGDSDRMVVNHRRTQSGGPWYLTLGCLQEIGMLDKLGLRQTGGKRERYSVAKCVPLDSSCGGPLIRLLYTSMFNGDVHVVWRMDILRSTPT